MIKPTPLQYDENALEPHISADTMNTHHGKHYAGYVENLNKLIKGTVHEGSDLEEIVTSSAGPIFNNAAQAYNHEFYFNCMSPNDTKVSDNLQSEIDKNWESLDKFKEVFITQGKKLFGSGWVWLVWNANEEQLQIMTTSNASTPISPEDGYSSEYIPLMNCDVWEHSYYIDHKNDRAAYLESFWKVINWEFVSNQYKEK